MAPTPSLLVKYTVRTADGFKDVTNRFHFNGGTPADDTAWHTLMDNVVDSMKTVLNTEQEITAVNGYAAGSDVAAASKSYSTAGTFDIPANSARQSPGFCCALIRWPTSARTTKNHPIYLFSYVHGVGASSDSGAGSQTLHATLKSRLETFAADWVAGFSDGTNTLVRAGPNGATGGAATVFDEIKDHDLNPR